MAKKLRVGMIGAGLVAQSLHLPTLALLNHLYDVVSICDISQQTVDHVAARFGISNRTTVPWDIVYQSDIDMVMILTTDEFHEELCISALKAGKLVFVEKPITLSLPSAHRIIEAEKAAGGNKVFVGYMRRYAPSFTQAFLREVATIPRIVYARSRDLIGHNDHFVAQSGTNPVAFSDYPPNAAQDRKERLDKLFAEAFPGRKVTERHIQYCRFLGGLGSHDLSLMREAIGFPESVAAVSANEPFYTAMFNYRNKTGEPYSVTYESGIDQVPRFDAHLAVYGEKKTVSIQYDTPFVKGLAIRVKVDELNENGEATTREILSTFEDAYTVELKEVYECFVNGKAIKTTAEDASKELELYDMMYKQLEKQEQQ